MLHKIKTLILSLSVLSIFAGTMALPAYALDPCTNSSTSACQLDQKDTLCAGSNFDLSGKADTQNCSDNATQNGLGPKIAKFINIFSAIIGVVAVIIIIYAGFRYVSSAGNEKAIEGAKNAIIYAIIGLVIVALAQAIVHFVVNNIS